MDSADLTRFPWASIAAGLIFLATGPGCSQLSSSRQPVPPMLGTQKGGAFDPYLAHHAPAARKGAPSPAGNQLVDRDGGAASRNSRSTAHPASPAEGSLVDASTPQPSVSLQPPVTLPTVANPKPQALASNDRKPPAIDPNPTLPSLVAPDSAKPAPPASQADAPTAESIVRAAREKLDKISTYQVALHRQERVNNSLLPEEDVILSVRRNPKAVRLEWPDGPHKGREVIYSAGENGGLMHVNMANAGVPLPRISLPPDSPMVMKNSRHPITEAGFDHIVKDLETSLGAGNVGAAKVVYAGIETPRQVGRPCYKLTRTTPQGENWIVYVDKETQLPSLVQAKDQAGELLERYTFSNLKKDLPELAAANSFDVNQRWGAGGFLSRLARGGSNDAGATARPTQR